MDIFGNTSDTSLSEADEHLRRAEEEQEEAARILRQEADQLNRQAEATEEGRLGGSTSSSWNPFG